MQEITVGQGVKQRQIAMRHTEGVQPALFWLGGFRSDMQGTKATYIEAQAKARGNAFVRFDYAGHGESSGHFADFTLRDWLEDTLAVLDASGIKQALLIGSSMGGWLATLSALHRPACARALMLLAPAHDFTLRLRTSMMPAQCEALALSGVYHMEDEETGETFAMTRAFFDEAEKLAQLGGPIPLAIPVVILQGGEDTLVPPHHSLEVMRLLESRDVRVHLHKTSDHRLSTPQDLRALWRYLEDLLERVGDLGKVGS